MHPLRTLALGVVVFVAGCTHGFPSFELTLGIDEQRILGSPLGGPLADTVPIPLEIDLGAETEARDTAPAEHVYLTALHFDVTTTAEPEGDTDDFDFVSSVDVWIESTQPGTTLPRLHVAGLENVPDGLRRLELVVDDADVIEYLREGSRLTATATGTAPPDDVTLDGGYSLVVDVDVL